MANVEKHLKYFTDGLNANKGDLERKNICLMNIIELKLTVLDNWWNNTEKKTIDFCIKFAD